MNKFFGLLLVGAVLVLTSCETTKEITFNPDGSGTMVTTTDMSGLIALAKMSGQGKELEKDDKAIDTTIALDKLVDSIPELNDEQRTLAKKGKLGLNISLADEKMMTKLHFPFSNASEISKLDELSAKVMEQTMKKQMGGDADSASPIPADALPKASMDDYFTMTYSKGLIERKVIAEKYAKVDDDKGMQSLKEMASEGMPMNTTLIFNLPKPAKKVEGKNAKLSEDKKKVTIVSSADDFFDDVAKMEFRIEY
jgi:hypothetical protein